MSNKKPKHIHFLGIGGSGVSSVAVLAKRQGFTVNGCDLQISTPYIKKVKKESIKVYKGHDLKHLKDVDLLVATPAAFFKDPPSKEFLLAQKRNKLMTWQEFLGKYLHRGKRVISIAGTHGKSTTTALASLLFEKAGKDPNVVIGATVNKWKSNFRFGKGRIFITEADEFFDNFLNYKSDTIILNNVELDHPDYFDSEEKVLKSFAKFVKKLTGSKTLVCNQDSRGIKKLFKILNNQFLNSINIVGYTFNKRPSLETPKSLYAEINHKAPSFTSFRVFSKSLSLNENFKINLPGSYNVANALGVIALARLFKIDMSIVKRTLSSYSGIGRRLELIGTKRGIKVYDDYAHHPTAISATLEALRQQFPKNRIWVIVEPHSYSRTKALLPKYQKAFNHADFVVIGPIFKARDTTTFGISGKSIVDVSEHPNIRYDGKLGNIVKSVKKTAKSPDIIVVMGAGLSYRWARAILNGL